MRYTTFTFAVITAFCSILMAKDIKGQSMENTQLQIGISNRSLEYSLKKIEKSTSFRFAYKADEVRSYSAVTVKEGLYSVAALVKMLLDDTGLEYRQNSNYILIIPKNNLGVDLSSPQAKEFTVTGRVVDAKGIGLPGITVKLKGSSIGAATDADGKYLLRLPDGNGTLVFSYVGYLTKEAVVDNRANIEVTLEEDSKVLNEVVVVGYGNQKRKDITSAISVVDLNDVSSRPIINAVEAITGKTAGVQISAPSGSPGASLSVKVRGIGSPNGGEPLYVIDGVLANDTKSIDPNSIESISILKDASAAGIYGAAGSTNGVVIITTKRGTKGAPRTDVNVYSGFQQIVKKLDVLDNAQWLDLQREISGTNPVIPAYYDLQNTNNNWQDLVYQNAMQTGANVSTSGGSEKGLYYFGMGYLDQEGIIVGSKFKRYSVKLNVEQNAAKWLKLGGNFSYNRTNQSAVNDNASAQFGGVVISALVTPQYIPIIMPAGAPNPGVYGTSNFYSGENPISAIYNSTNKTIGNNLLGNAFAEISLPFEIKFKSQLNATVENSKYDYFQDPYKSLSGISRIGEARSTASEVARWAWDNTLTYNKMIGEHSINVVAGTSALEERIATSNQYGSGFSSNAVQTLNGASTQFQIGTANYDWSTNSYFGRLNYSYNDKYLFTATIRRDGSSRVGSNVVWGSFPAFSAGWKLSNEGFMKDVKWVRDLKIRAGYGETGNLPPYTILYPSYNLLNAGAPYAYGGNVAAPGISTSGQFGNDNLRWEKAQQTNLGLDASFLDGRLTLSVDYYHKKVVDMIFTQQLPLTTGGAFTALNLPGSDINKGVEFSMDGTIFKKTDFSWDANFNLSINKNIITDIDPSISFQTGPIAIGGSRAPIYAQIIKNGYPLGTFWGYQALGVDPQTGNLKYSATPGDLGSALPKFTAGLTNNFRYKSVSLSFIIDGVQGNKVYNATRMETEALSGYTSGSAAMLDRWRKPGDITDIPRALGNGTTNTAAAALLQNQISSNYIEDGSFARLRNVTVSYQFENAWVKKLGISSAKLYLTAQNLVTLTRYSGYYPEVNGFGQGTNNQAVNAGAATSLMSLGIDRGTYPAAKTFTAGINVQF